MKVWKKRGGSGEGGEGNNKDSTTKTTTRPAVISKISLGQSEATQKKSDEFLKEVYEIIGQFTKTKNRRRLFQIDFNAGFMVSQGTLEKFNVDAEKLATHLGDETLKKALKDQINALTVKYKLDAFKLKDMSAQVSSAGLKAGLKIRVDGFKALDMFNKVMASGMKKAMKNTVEDLAVAIIDPSEPMPDFKDIIDILLFIVDNFSKARRLQDAALFFEPACRQLQAKARQLTAGSINMYSEMRATPGSGVSLAQILKAAKTLTPDILTNYINEELKAAGLPEVKVLALSEPVMSGTASNEVSSSIKSGIWSGLFFLPVIYVALDLVVREA